MLFSDIKQIFYLTKNLKNYPKANSFQDNRSLSVCLSVCLHVCLYVCLSVCLSVCLPVCMSVCLPVCLAVRLSKAFGTSLLIIIRNSEEIPYSLVTTELYYAGNDYGSSGINLEWSDDLIEGFSFASSTRERWVSLFTTYSTRESWKM